MEADIKYSECPLVDRRAYERYPITLPGQLFVTEETPTITCLVKGLSPGGASVQCAEAPPLDAFVVLYLEGFGRFDSVPVHFDDDILGLSFVCTDAKRNRLKEML